MFYNFTDTGESSFTEFVNSVVDAVVTTPLMADRVVINKIDNSIVFTPDGPTIKLTAARTEWDLANCVKIVATGAFGHTNWIKQELKKRMRILVIAIDRSSGQPEVAMHESD